MKNQTAEPSFDYAIEAKTKHDVNAVVVFISKRLAEINRKDLVPLVHFGLTSEDINNTAYSLMVKEARDGVMVPEIKKILGELRKLSKKHASLPMLSLTHGQPATTTTLGKEMAVFLVRAERQLSQISSARFLAR